MVGHERLSSSAAGNGVEHGGLDGDEVAVVEPAAHIGVDLCACDKDVASLVVHHEVEVALAEALLGVLEAVVVIGDLVQAGGQKSDLDGADGQLAGEVALALLLGRVGAGGEAADADDVAAAEVKVLLIEGDGLCVTKVCLGEDLETGSLGADVVEIELAACGATNVDAAGELNLPSLVGLTVLDVLELLFELANVVGDVELGDISFWKGRE